MTDFSRSSASDAVCEIWNTSSFNCIYFNFRLTSQPIKVNSKYNSKTNTQPKYLNNKPKLFIKKLQAIYLMLYKWWYKTTKIKKYKHEHVLAYTFNLSHNVILDFVGSKFRCHDCFWDAIFSPKPNCKRIISVATELWALNEIQNGCRHHLDNIFWNPPHSLSRHSMLACRPRLTPKECLSTNPHSVSFLIFDVNNHNHNHNNNSINKYTE